MRTDVLTFDYTTLWVHSFDLKYNICTNIQELMKQNERITTKGRCNKKHSIITLQKYTMLSLHIGWQETKLQTVYWYKNSNNGSSLWDYL